jgi:hypothetical protein
MPPAWPAPRAYSYHVLESDDWAKIIDAMDSRERALLSEIKRLQDALHKQVSELTETRAEASDAIARVQNLESILHARGLV